MPVSLHEGAAHGGGSMKLRHASRALVPVVVAALALSACGGDDDDSSAEGTTTTTTAARDGSTTSSTAGTSEFVVGVANTDLGDTLVDAEGKTLYIFDADSNGKSSCNAGCDATWPPLVTTGDVTVSEDLDSSLFATIQRDDGSTQVTVDGKPLYTYAADANPGDTTGDAVGGVWHAAGTDGSALGGDGTGDSGSDTTAAPAASPGY
jgi:predicted lipoprotein with Yx(FWY)xxD motif